MLTVRFMLICWLLVPSPSHGRDRHRDEPFLPAHRPSDLIIEHLGYTLCYSEEDEQAVWVAYELTGQEAEGRLKRSDDFRADPKIPTGSASPDDYKNTGYDRGHLAPAADMGWSKTAMSESFFMSNMSPQKPALNRGAWKELEEQVRLWGRQNGALYVVTGPVLTRKPLDVIGKNRVTVPAAYYKVVVDVREPGVKGVGFLMPNAAWKEALQSAVVPIDSVEKVTGLDFFPALDDPVEHAVEASIDLAAWTWPGERVAASENRPRTSDARRAPAAAEKGWKNLALWLLIALVVIVILLIVLRRLG
jgi:endonuclease G